MGAVKQKAQQIAVELGLSEVDIHHPDVIAEFSRREVLHMEKEEAEKQALEIWETLDQGERLGVKMGLFPAEKMPKEHSMPLTMALMKLAEGK